MNNNFARRVILDAVKQEIAKRYPDSTLRFSTIYQACPEMVIILAKPLADSRAKSFRHCLLTKDVRSIALLIDRLEIEVDWFK